jgi:hypothetical protein
MEKFQIKIDQDGNVLSTRSYSASDLSKMKLLYDLYRGAFHYSTLKYLLYFAQVDHGIPAGDFLLALLDHLLHSGGRTPQIFSVLRYCVAHDRNSLLAMNEMAWRQMYGEILAFADEKLGFQGGSGADAIVDTHIALMPRLDRKMPEQTMLAHDVPKYFAQFFRVRDLANFDRRGIRRLEDFESVTLQVDDPDEICGGGYAAPWDGHQFRWELSSRLSAPPTDDGYALDGLPAS